MVTKWMFNSMDGSFWRSLRMGNCNLENGCEKSSTMVLIWWILWMGNLPIHHPSYCSFLMGKAPALGSSTLRNPRFKITTDCPCGAGVQYETSATMVQSARGCLIQSQGSMECVFDLFFADVWNGIMCQWKNPGSKKPRCYTYVYVCVYAPSIRPSIHSIYLSIYLSINLF